MKNFGIQSTTDVELQSLSAQHKNLPTTNVNRCWICLKKYLDNNKHQKLFPCCKCRFAHSICMLNFSSTYNITKCDCCFENYHVNILPLISRVKVKCELSVQSAKFVYRFSHLLAFVVSFVLSLIITLYLAKLLIILWLGQLDIVVNDVMHVQFPLTNADLILAPISWLIFLPTATFIGFFIFVFKNCIVSLGSHPR
jgi:hypothetical protein